MARLRLLPAYIFASETKQKELIYVIDKANWTIKWDGINITRELANIGRRASLDTSVTLHRKKILHFGSSYVFSARSFRPTSLNNIVVMTFFHGNYGADEGLNKNLDYLRANIHRINGIAISTSIMKHRFIEELGIPEEKLFLVPIGVDLDVYRPAPENMKLAVRREKGIPDDAFVVGSFQKDGLGWHAGDKPKLIKGPDIFVKTLKEVSRSRKVFCLLTGPARGYIKNELDAAEIPYLHEYFNHPAEVAKLYHALDAYAITSREEGGPKALLEALASGVPVVSTDVGMAGDVMAAHNCGIICPVGDVPELRNALNQVAEDGELVEKFTANGVKRAQDYSWRHVAKACDAMYRVLEYRAGST